MQIARLVERAAQRWPTKVATLSGDGKLLTWSESRGRIARLAAGLHSLGVRRGDRVALLAGNSQEYFESFFAACWADAVIVPMNTRFSVKENLYCAEDCSPVVLIVDALFADQAKELAERVGSIKAVVAIGKAADLVGAVAYEDLIRVNENIALGNAGADDLAGIFYTGGTTGFPKGVMLSHTNLFASSSSFWLELGVLPNSMRYLHAAPMFHLADASQTIGVTMHGGAHAFLATFDPVLALECIAAWEITDVVLVPTMLQRMFDHEKRSGFDLRSLKRIIYGGSPMPPALLERVQAAFPEIEFAQCYGQTEMAPVVTVLPPQDHRSPENREERIASVGRPALGIDVKIVDGDLVEVAPGETGQIAARGRNRMLGYWNQSEQTQKTIVDGWVLTGDAGYVDADGYVHLVDRVKDMIVTGGENVYSVEVENALCRFPGVRAAAVIGIPSERWGEAVHAFVIADPAAAITHELLTEHCKSLIAGYKCPKSIDFVADLPLSAAGKVLKQELRQRYWHGTKRIN